jgi:hypothetical protein
MTRQFSEAKRADIIKALKANPNATQVAKEIGGIHPASVMGIAKKAKIALRRGGQTKVSAEKHAQIIAALKANPNASQVARQIGGISYKTVARIAKRANIRLAALISRTVPTTARGSQTGAA